MAFIITQHQLPLIRCGQCLLQLRYQLTFAVSNGAKEIYCFMVDSVYVFIPIKTTVQKIYNQALINSSMRVSLSDRFYFIYKQ